MTSLRLSTGASHGAYWRRLSTALALDRTLTATILCVAFASLFLFTRAQYYTFDSVSYAYSILRFDRTGDRFALYHPHHLLFNVTGWLLWRLCRQFGYIGGPLEVLKTMNGVLGGIGIGLLSLTLRSVLTRSRALAVILPIGLGLSFGYWVCATDGRVNMASVVLSIAAFYALVLTMQSPTSRRALATGVVSAIAMLYHESAGLFLLVGWLGIWLAEYAQGAEEEERRARLKLLGIYTAAWLAVTIIPYMIVGVGYLHLRSAAGFKDWAARYAILGWWWDFRILHNLRSDAYAIRKCLFTEPTGKQGTFYIDRGSTLFGFWAYIAALAGWLIATYEGLIALPLLLKTHYRRYIAITIVYIVVNTAFFTVWQPDYFVFRVSTVMAMCLLMAIVSSHYRAQRYGPLWLAAIGIWIALYGMSNYILSIGPHVDPKSNPYMVMADDIRHRTDPRDLIVMPGAGFGAQDEVYIPYFAQRDVFSIHTEMAHHHEDYALMARALQSQMARARASGGTVYVFDDIYEPGLAEAMLLRQHNITRPMLLSLFAGQLRTKAWVTPRRDPMWRLTGPQTPPAPVSTLSTANHSRTPGLDS